jgi:predicted TIM-barrel fold metal-dependent hydrolase
MLIDAHHHLADAADYADRLAEHCAELGIDKVCLFGAGKRSRQSGHAGNGQVLSAARKYLDLIVPYACFDLGEDAPNRIDEFMQQGFRGVKFIYPTANYDDKAFYPVYGRLEGYGVPAIFHLGIVSRTPYDKYYDIDNNRHRPIYLDTIARAFPELTIIGAHLGNPWYEEAAMAARWNPNLYFDLSGSTLKCKSAQFLGALLWWTATTRYRDPIGRGAWEKIVFGSDVPAEEIHDVLADYRRVMGELAIGAELQAKVLGETMAQILGLGQTGR